MAPIAVDPQDGALLVLGAGPVLDLLLYGAAEEALRITLAVSGGLVGAVVAGAARVGRGGPRLQHADQHGVARSQRVAHHCTVHCLPALHSSPSGSTAARGVPPPAPRPHS